MRMTTQPFRDDADADRLLLRHLERMLLVDCYAHSALWAGLQGEYRCPSRQPTLGRKCLNLNQKKCKFLYDQDISGGYQHGA